MEENTITFLHGESFVVRIQRPAAYCLEVFLQQVGLENDDYLFCLLAATPGSYQ